MYAIAKVKHHYYTEGIPTTPPEVIIEKNGEIAVWEDFKSARAWVDEQARGVYTLAHDECSKPTYYVLSWKVAEYIHTGRNSDGGNYNWEHTECDCGQCQACANEMAHQDRMYVHLQQQYMN